VLYRTEVGDAVALADRCPHRNLPLSAGRLVGDVVQCGYHGLEFDPSGACVKAPGEPRIPPWCEVRSYPVAERYGWLFIWTGDPALAEAHPVPDFHAELTDPQWGGATGELTVGCGYRLMLDNLLDLSHLAYVHDSSTGNADVANAATVDVASDNDRHVRQTRLMRGVTPAPAFTYYGGYDGPIDRWQMTDYFAPSYIRINNGSRRQGSADDAIDCRTDLGDWGFRVFHALTPETETTTHQFWAVPFRRDMVKDEDHALWQEQMDNVLHEDHEVYVQQQAAIADDPLANNDARPAGALRGDRGLYEMRRVIKRLYQEET
jgi:vanillate O-demethylase monooxygenase subunit